MSVSPQLTPVAERDQRVFRVLLDCMARPGSTGTIPVEDSAAGEWDAAIAVCRCLLDHEVSFAVASDTGLVAEHLLRATGSRLASVEAADYVLTPGSMASDVVRLANVGTDEFPDESATVIIVCAENDSGVLLLNLTGPGIEGKRTFPLTGVDRSAIDQLQEQNADYPLGIDVILAFPAGRIACLPRTTLVSINDSVEEN